MLKMTIEVNKKLLPSIQKHKLDREIQMRIMKRVGELKNELKEIEEGGAGQRLGLAHAQHSKANEYCWVVE